MLQLFSKTDPITLSQLSWPGRGEKSKVTTYQLSMGKTNDLRGGTV